VRVAEAVADAAERLTAARVASARVDAELLAAYVLGIPRARLAATERFTNGQAKRYAELIEQRATRVPLQHLTGKAAFRYLELDVGPGVFVPRPETEVLVEWGLRWLRANRAFREPTSERGTSVAKATPDVVVDLCAGSGAIAASVATEAPGTTVYAVERERDALGWLRRNGLGLGVIVVEGDATDPDVLSELDGQVDLVLCNPPYVPEIGAAWLPAEVTRHDPHVAVFGGTDGLDVIRPLIGRFATLLRPGGAVAVEHEDVHAYVVPTLVHADGRFVDVEVHHDLAQRPRFTTARRAGDLARMADFRT
jgi:release factor glutamine methyltransferase